MSVFAGEEGQELHVAKAECLPPLIIPVIFVALCLYIACFVGVPIMAHRRHRSMILWSLMSLFITPFITIILLSYLGKITDYTRQSKFNILDFIFWRAAEIYARRGLGPIGPEKLYTGAHPDNLVSFPVAAITLIIPCLIYKLFFRYTLDIEAYQIGWVIVFALYFLLVSIAFERRYNRIPIDMLREKYKSSRLDRLVPDFAIILVPILLCIGGILFAFYNIIWLF
jgi:hypothetical protein